MRGSKTESGQGLIEYALIAALVAIALTLVLLMFGDSVGSGFDTINSGLESEALQRDGPNGCNQYMPKLKNKHC